MFLPLGKEIEWDRSEGFSQMTMRSCASLTGLVALEQSSQKIDLGLECLLVVLGVGEEHGVGCGCCIYLFFLIMFW